jgi:glycosyltransferase involved in cell wall biosynthesis
MIKEKSKKNILFYYMNGNSGGGSDNSLYLHLINLNKEKFTPFVIFKKRSNLVKKIQSMNLMTIHQKYFSNTISTRLKIPGCKTIFFNLRVVFELFIIIRIIIKFEIDIIHLNNNIRTNRAAAIAGLLTFKKVIVHDRIGTKLGVADKLLLKKVNKIIVISESVKMCYADLKLDESKIIKIFNGVDTSKFMKLTRSKTDQIIIGSVGRLVNWKGIDVLIHAVPEVLEKFSNVKFLIAGEGSAREALETLAKELNLQESVIFLGSIKNINEIYNSMDIFVHTAIEPEPFGRVIIEAMANGLPVISTNIGGPKEIITDGKDGFLLSPGDSSILAKKIIYLIENAEIRNKIAQQAILRVKNEFDIKLATEKLKKSIKKL